MNAKFTVPEAAADLGCVVSTLRDMISQQRIGSHKVGRRRYLTRQDLDAYIASTSVLPLLPPGANALAVLRSARNGTAGQREASALTDGDWKRLEELVAAAVRAAALSVAQTASQKREAVNS